VSRWAFSPRHLWPWAIYCGLPRTSITGMHRSGLVSEVSLYCVVSCRLKLNQSIFRCTAPADDLDSTEAGRRSHVHTDALLNTYSLKILWEDYGIVGNVVVSAIPLVCGLYLITNSYSLSRPDFPGLIFMSSYALISSTRSSKALSRTISSLGWASTLSRSMAPLAPLQ
jgi:hypothetical protein